MLETHRVDFGIHDASQLGYSVRIDGTDVTHRLFDPDVTSAVSAVASQPGVRAKLVERQREIAREGPVVMAGRDIGTVVLPDARYKFFLTASLDERARRRQTELAERGVDADLDEVRAQIQERDRLDETRATSPLRRAADAVLIDSTGISAEAVVELNAGDDPQRGVTFYDFARAVTGAWCYGPLRMRVFGVENVPRSGPLIVACNHVSYVDPVALGVALPRRVWYMAKVELFRIPVLGAVRSRRWARIPSIAAKATSRRFAARYAS